MSNERIRTTVSSAEAVGEPVDVSVVSPSRHVNKEVRWVLNGEAKSESVYTNIWNSDVRIQLMLHYSAEDACALFRIYIYSPEEGAAAQDAEAQSCKQDVSMTMTLTAAQM